jgi:hypothetical protein
MRAHGAELWTQDAGAAQKHKLNWIAGVGESGLGRKRIHWGGNSGFQAINLAYLWGVRRIVLLGFDMQLAPDGSSHWFGEHPHEQGFANPKKFNSWIRHLEVMGRDLSDQAVMVLNASRQTALTCFARMPIDQIPD